VSQVLDTQRRGGGPTAAPARRGWTPEISPASVPVGVLIRAWRERRHLSQQRLAEAAAVSARHLSFLETSRSLPSRAMLRRLAEQLELPLRERNRLLLAAGFAPEYDERPLERGEPDPVRVALAGFLRAHEPCPAMILDRHFNLVDANAGFARLTTTVARDLLEPPANPLRVCLHPRGLAPEIVNLSQWSAHALQRVRRHADRSGAAELDELYEELAGYPGVATEPPSSERCPLGIVTLRLRRGSGDELAFFTTTTQINCAVDVALSELTIEAFHPADPPTARAIIASGEQAADAGQQRDQPAAGRLAAPRGKHEAVPRTPSNIRFVYE
jgi:transcriptional regulator with XRE-family HTH domain